jgi:hypothetical protein
MNGYGMVARILSSIAAVCTENLIRVDDVMESPTGGLTVSGALLTDLHLPRRIRLR